MKHTTPQIKESDAIEVLERVTAEQGFLGTIQVDNGPKFASKGIEQRA